MSLLKKILSVCIVSLGCVSAHGTAIRVPFSSSSYTTEAGVGSLTSFELGSLAVGMSGYKSFSYLNKSDTRVVVSNITYSENVRAVDGNCSVIEPGESCYMTFALAIGEKGVNKGSIAFAVSKNATSYTDSFELIATGVAVSDVLQLQPTSGKFSFYGDTQSFSVKNTQKFGVSIGAITSSSPYWSVSSSTCAEILEPEQTCTINVRYISTRGGSFSANIKINVGGIVYSTLPVSGNLLVGSHSFDSTKMYFTGLTPGVLASNSITLTNKGAGKLIVSAVSVQGDPSLSIKSSSCQGATLEPNQSCVTDINALMQKNNLTATATLQYSFLNATVSNAAIEMHADSLATSVSKILTGDPSLISFGVVPQGSTPITNISLKSNGTSPVRITSISVTGANSAAFSVNKSLCLKSLSAAETCTLPVSFDTSKEGEFNANVAIASDADTKSLDIPVSGIVVGAKLEASPASVNFSGFVSDAYFKTITVTNIGLFDTTIKSVVSENNYFSIDNNNCLSSPLSPGKKCTFNLTIGKPTVGANTSVVTIAHSSGSVVKSITIPVSSTILTNALSLDPFECPAAMVGEAGVCSSVLRNNSNSAITISNLKGSNASFGTPYLVNSTVLPYVLAANSFKTITVPFKFSSAGVFTNTITITNSGPVVSGNASVAVSAVPLAVGDLSPFNCPSAVIGTSTTCTATLTNTSTVKALAISGINIDNKNFVLSHNCGSSLGASKNCVISAKIVPLTMNPYAALVTVNTNPVLKGSLLVNVLAPKFSVKSPDPVVGVVGNTTVNQTSVFTNISGFPVDLATALKRVTGAGFKFVSTTCTGVILNGDSCSITNSFGASAVITDSTGTAKLVISEISFVADLKGATKTDSLKITKLPGNTSIVGFRSMSGNKYTVTNLGARPQVISSLNSIPGFAIGLDPEDINLCSVGKQLQPGANCNFYEYVNVATRPADNTLFAGAGSLATKLGTKATWALSYKMVQPTIAVAPSLSNKAVGEPIAAVIKISNPTNAELAGVSVLVAPSSPSIVMTGNLSCSQSILPGNACELPVNIIAKEVVSGNISLKIVGKFAKERNGHVIGLGDSDVQAVASVPISTVPLAGAFTIQAYPTAERGATSRAQHSFKNTGVSSMTISTLVIRSGTGDNQAIISEECTGKVLKSQESCIFTTSFYNDGRSVPFKSAIIDATTEGGRIFSGVIDATAAGAASVDAKNTFCTPLSILHGQAVMCQVTVKNNGAGKLALNQVMVRVMPYEFQGEPKHWAGPTDYTVVPASSKSWVGDGGIIEGNSFNYFAFDGSPSKSADGNSYVSTSLSGGPAFMGVGFDQYNPYPKFGPLPTGYYTSPVNSPGTQYSMWGGNDINGRPGIQAYRGHVYLEPGEKVFVTFLVGNLIADGSTQYGYYFPKNSTMPLITLTNRDKRLYGLWFTGWGPSPKVKTKITAIITGAENGEDAWSFDMNPNKGRSGYFKPLVNYQVEVNPNVFKMDMTSSVSKGTTVLNAGQFATFQYANNTPATAVFNMGNYWWNAVYFNFGGTANNKLYADPSFALNNKILDAKEGWSKEVYALMTFKYFVNPATSKQEYIIGNPTTGFITATTCAPSSNSVPSTATRLLPGESCYTRQACWIDPISGVDIRYGKVTGYQMNNNWYEPGVGVYGWHWERGISNSFEYEDQKLPGNGLLTAGYVLKCDASSLR